MSRASKITILCLCAFVATGCERSPDWTSPSGLQVTEITEGEGVLPEKGDILSVVYTAWYVDGKEFDRYLDRESPYRFRVGMKQVLPGLDEGVFTMRAGGKRVLILPPELAFGNEGKGMVPPDTWVKFEVELLKIEPGPVPPQPWNDAGYEITVTLTGLQYVDFAIGEGESPTREGEVTVHYSGFLDNGALFDSSYFGGGPIRFSLAGGELIPGWIEGLLTMKAGGMRKLIIPPYLAYGEKGFADKVPPNATLVYDIQLIAVRNTP